MIISNTIENKHQIPLTKAKARLDSLQIVRGLGAIMIFCSHSFNSEKYWAWGGWGVSLFFVLSGFLMTYAYYDRDISTHFVDALKFMTKKLKKLYLLHLGVMVYLLFMMKSLTLKTVILNLFLLKTWHPQEKIYFSMGGVSWFLCTIALSYLLFPFILRRIKSLANTKKALWHLFIIYAIMFVIGFLTSLVHISSDFSNNFSKWITYVFPPFRLGDFIIGCDLGFIFLNRLPVQVMNQSVHNKERIWFTIVEILVIIITCVCIHLRHQRVWIFGKSWFGPTLLWLPLTSIIIFCFACYKGLISRFLTRFRLLKLVGDLSPYTFLIHVHVMSLCVKFIALKETGLTADLIIYITAFLFTQMLGSIIKKIIN